jgi:hypothetical protein
MSGKSADTAVIVGHLRETLERLIAQSGKAALTSRARRALEGEIRNVIDELGQFLNDLDPIRQPAAVFDPSNPKVVGRFVSLALVAQPRHPLGEIARFYGSGVYAIYYNGPFKLYAPISGTENPIYVGQAAPAVNNARTPMEQGDRLCRRLEDHRKSVGRAVSTLDTAHFEFRSLVVQSGWETAAEDYLIHLFHPIWNSETNILYGLGKHGDSAETRANKRSPWDTLHPGRPWAGHGKLADAKPTTQIASELARHFKAHPAFQNLESVLNSFIEELRQV